MSESSSVSPLFNPDEFCNCLSEAAELALGQHTMGQHVEWLQTAGDSREAKLEAQLQEATRTLDAIHELSERYSHEDYRPFVRKVAAEVASLLGEQKEAGS